MPRREPRAAHRRGFPRWALCGLAGSLALFVGGCGEPEATTETTELRLRQHVSVLASEAFEGRATGRAGERLAARYLADAFRAAGLTPAGEDGFLQPFAFPSGVRLGDGNALNAKGLGSLVLGEEWLPLAFSDTGDFGPGSVVFAGYGFAAPGAGEIAAFDSYGEVDVSGAWLLVLRDWPEHASDEERQHWGRYAGLRYKAILARERGAIGLLVVQRTTDPERDALIPLRFDGTAGSAGIPTLSLSEAGADRLLAGTGHTVAALRDRLDEGEALDAFAIPGSELGADVRLELERSSGVNVVGRLGVGDPEAPAIVVGAHFDHLGRGGGRGSLARAGEREGIHYGADDNASGVAALVEIARALRARIDAGTLDPARDAIFAAWSGEELGLLGSHAFATRALGEVGAAAIAPNDESAEQEGLSGTGGGAGTAPAADPHAGLAAPPALRDRVAANLNLDMVGRLRETLLLQGGGSSTRWADLVEDTASRVSIRVELQEESLLPTDASSFVTRGVPVLSAFTGAHGEYHTPRDTPDTLNYTGIEAVTRLFTEIAAALLASVDVPDYVAPRRGQSPHPRRAVRLRAYLGTVPDYAAAVSGLALATVVADGPAERAGLRGGDVVVELAGRPVRNVYDYTFAIEALRPGETVAVALLRDGQGIELEITPESRN